MFKKSTIHHFPVGNGDMTLIKIASGDKLYTVLVDMYIRQCSVEDDNKCDVLTELHGLIESDDQGRPYVDVLLLTHPDEDHILGFEKHFHVGKPENYKLKKNGEKEKIFINELWSSPIVFRRKCAKTHTLCADADSFAEEARRRVADFRSNSNIIGAEGNRIRIIGKDVDNKTDNIMDIVYELGDEITKLNETVIPELKVLMLGPLHDNEFPEGTSPDKNRSSVIMQWAIASNGYTNPTNHILLGGDAGVEVWEILWKKHNANVGRLKYDILLAPHHCSWHTLSYDSWSKSVDPKVSADALSALSQAKDGAVIISSSDNIKNDKSDPPNYQAMKEYQKIVQDVGGEFKCLADQKKNTDGSPEILTYRLTLNGPQLDVVEKPKKAASISIITGGEAIGHG